MYGPNIGNALLQAEYNMLCAAAKFTSMRNMCSVELHQRIVLLVMKYVMVSKSWLRKKYMYYGHNFDDQSDVFTDPNLTCNLYLDACPSLYHQGKYKVLRIMTLDYRLMTK